MPSRKIEDCHPDLQPLLRSFLLQCGLKCIDVLVTCTYRSAAEQDALYAQGRTTPGKIVTNARAGQSKHNFKLADGTPASKAFDIVPMEHGKPTWDPKHPAWQTAGAVGESLGLEWAGRWVAFKEYPHFQLKS